jgi:hypothetical protein
MDACKIKFRRAGDRPDQADLAVAGLPESSGWDSSLPPGDA